MRPRIKISLVVIVLFVVPTALAADCYTYNNSSVQHDDYYGYYCGGTGGTCTECSSYDPNVGTQVCVWSTPFDVWCTHYGPEYQW